MEEMGSFKEVEARELGQRGFDLSLVYKKKDREQTTSLGSESKPFLVTLEFHKSWSLYI